MSDYFIMSNRNTPAPASPANEARAEALRQMELPLVWPKARKAPKKPAQSVHADPPDNPDLAR